MAQYLPKGMTQFTENRGTVAALFALESNGAQEGTTNQYWTFLPLAIPLWTR